MVGGAWTQDEAAVENNLAEARYKVRESSDFYISWQENEK